MYKFIDLFAGIGGFRIAFEKFNNTCVFSSDIDKYCQQVYNHNFGETPEGDITKVNENNIPDFDILTAGFPCQPFSYSGQLKGFEDKTRGTLFFDIVRILKKKKPKMFLLENVKGLKSHRNGETLDTIINILEKELGYTVYWKVLNSHDFGVPQARQRWYCVGFDKKIAYKFPSPTNQNTTLADIVDISTNTKGLALSKFDQERIDFHFTNFSPEKPRVQHDNSKYESHTKKGRHGVFSYLKPDGALRFHIGDFAKTQIQEAYFVSLKSVAPTIIASRDPKLWDLRRKLSVVECKKLQGFPDWFKFNVSDNQAKKQLGNAVTVPVITEIAKSMIDAYEEDQQIEQQLRLT